MMSPEQKTHLTVGSLILLSLITYWVSSTWYPLLVPALLGFGLVRAGITGNCPMTNWWKTCSTTSDNKKD